MDNKNTKTCWVITEGIAGTENQCIGVAEAMGISPTIKRVKLNTPWKQLTPYLRIFNGLAISKDGDEITAPWPDIAICSGRKSIPAALHIKKASKGKTCVVQIQDPRCNPKLFDLVFIPIHDPTRGENVHLITGGLNRITRDKLKNESKKFAPFFKDDKKQKIAVLIGGKSKAHDFTDASIKKLCEQLKSLSQNYNLMITASRRTGEKRINYLKTELSNNEAIYFYDGEGENPYFAFMERADYILCTQDSVSMISEALTVSKPTYIIEMEGGGKRIDKFHEHILNEGYAKMFDGTLKPYDPKPLNETKRVAEIIENFIENRQ